MLDNPACLFCRIIVGEIPATIVYADDAVIAFRDIAPQAPIHILIIPRRHIAGLFDAEADSPASPTEGSIYIRLLSAARHIAVQHGLSEKGCRMVINCGPDGGQTVDHLHMHLLGGRQMTWPPG